MTIGNIMDIILRNIPKSNPYCIVVSTPNKPDDLMDRIMKEPFETSIWKKMYLDYTYGVGKIYTKEEIDKFKHTSSFPREFCLKFKKGNVLSSASIDRCIATGNTLAASAALDNWNIETSYIMSIDIGWGSSNTAIMVSRYVNGKIQIIYSKEYTRPLFQDIINEVWELKRKCGDSLQNIIIDAANTELYTSLCTEFNQNASRKYLEEKQRHCIRMWLQSKIPLS